MAVSLFIPKLLALSRTATWFVDGGTSIAVANQDGTESRPFSRIQAAIDALPVQTTNAEMLVYKHILIAPGQYDEDLAINMSWRRLVIAPWGSGDWKLGTFDGNFANPVAPFRNFVISGSMTVVDNIRPELRILGSSPGEYVSVVRSGPSISGDLTEDFDVTGIGFEITFEGYIHGDITLNADNTTGLTLRGGTVLGAITNGNHVWHETNVHGIVDVNILFKAINCNTRENITVAVSTASLSGVRGFIGCGFDNSFGAQVFTGPAGSFVADFYSNKQAKDEGVTLAGGATTTLLCDTVALV